MKTVYTCFSTDVIHEGHLNIINEAQKHGRVVVGCLSDKASIRYNRFPTISEKWGRNIDLKTLSVDGERAYEESYGAIEQSNATSRNSANEGLMQPFPSVSQDTKYPQSLVGRAYHGIVKTSNAEYDRSYDCHYTTVMISLPPESMTVLSSNDMTSSIPVSEMHLRSFMTMFLFLKDDCCWL